MQLHRLLAARVRAAAASLSGLSEARGRIQTLLDENLRLQEARRELAAEVERLRFQVFDHQEMGRTVRALREKLASLLPALEAHLPLLQLLLSEQELRWRLRPDGRLKVVVTVPRRGPHNNPTRGVFALQRHWPEGDTPAEFTLAELEEVVKKTWRGLPIRVRLASPDSARPPPASASGRERGPHLALAEEVARMQTLVGRVVEGAAAAVVEHVVQVRRFEEDKQRHAEEAARLRQQVREAAAARARAESLVRRLHEEVAAWEAHAGAPGEADVRMANLAHYLRHGHEARTPCRALVRVAPQQHPR